VLETATRSRRPWEIGGLIKASDRVSEEAIEELLSFAMKSTRIRSVTTTVFLGLWPSSARFDFRVRPISASIHYSMEPHRFLHELQLFEPKLDLRLSLFCLTMSMSLRRSANLMSETPTRNVRLGIRSPKRDLSRVRIKA